MLQPILAIDTSCYTTSLALVDGRGGILLDRRKLLAVKPGEWGLRQSEAIFQHIQNLPELLQEYTPKRVAAVAASTKPRPVDGSYLPVFRAGSSFGETIAKLWGVPFLPTSHQEGHIRAGLYDFSKPADSFLAWHLSGGTTELLRVKSNGPGYLIEKVGGSTDLQVGQFIDRVGVALGTGFPAGPALETLALNSQDTGTLPVVVNGLTVSFSGPASAAERVIQSGKMPPETLARQVFDCIARTIFKATLNGLSQYGSSQVLLVGGVASNQIIRDYLQGNCPAGIQIVFAPKMLSSDNAVGVALLGYDFLSKGPESWKESF